MEITGQQMLDFHQRLVIAIAGGYAANHEFGNRSHQASADLVMHAANAVVEAYYNGDLPPTLVSQLEAETAKSEALKSQLKEVQSVSDSVQDGQGEETEEE